MTTPIVIAPRTFFTAACAVGLVWLLIRLWPILLVVTSALILVGTISPLVEAVEHRGFRRNIAIAAVFTLFWGGALLLCLLAAPPFGRQLLSFVDDAPAIQSRLADLLSQNHLTNPLAEAVQRFRLEKLLMGDATHALSYSTGIAEIVGYTLTSVVLALYIVADRDRARGSLYALVPRPYHVRLARILLNMETIVGGYMRGQLLTSLAIAVFVFALLSICRVPGALALAAFAGLTDVIPFVGGLLATVPAVVAALRLNLTVALIVCAALLAYQQFESRILVPRVYGRALRLPSAAVVLALLIGGKILGIVGALLALPIAAGLRMMVEELRVEMPGDDSHDAALRARDERAEEAYHVRSSGSSPEEAAAVASEIATESRDADVARPITGEHKHG